jgi:hypothetical protein
VRRKKLDFKIDDNGCFVITSHKKTGGGYGYMYLNGKHHRIHRLVYEECFGELQEGLVIRHKCDNRICINPEHLETGSNKDNSMDAVSRKRNAFGSRNGRAKITEEQAKEIKNLLQNGLTVTSVMLRMNLSRKIVRSIKEGKTWRHVA